MNFIKLLTKSNPLNLHIKIRKCSEVVTTTIEKSLNQVILLGRVGAPPQRKGNIDHPIVTFSLATNSNFVKDNGRVEQRTEWHKITIFKPGLRELVEKYLSKGQRVLVQGRLMYGEIKDVEGITHPSTTIAADDVIFITR